MQAIELEAVIDERHQIHVALPPSVPAGKARVIVLYEPSESYQASASRIALRLDELRALEDGWLDGKGLAPSPEDLDWLAQALASSYPDDLPLPYLYPTAEGGIQAEWSMPGHEITLEIALARRQGEWHALRMETEETSEHILDLNTDDGWSWLSTQMRLLSRAAS